MTNEIIKRTCQAVIECSPVQTNIPCFNSFPCFQQADHTRIVRVIRAYSVNQPSVVATRRHSLIERIPSIISIRISQLSPWCSQLQCVDLCLFSKLLEELFIGNVPTSWEWWEESPTFVTYKTWWTIIASVGFKHITVFVTPVDTSKETGYRSMIITTVSLRIIRCRINGRDIGTN